MELLADGIKHAQCHQDAWAIALRGFNGRDIETADQFDRLALVGACIVDPEGTISEDWLAALSVTERSRFSVVMLTSRHELSYLTELVSDSHNVVATTAIGRKVDGHILTRAPLFDLYLTEQARAAKLLLRTLPPAFLSKDDARLSHAEPIAISGDFEPHFDTAAEALRQFRDELAEQPIFQRLEAAAESVTFSIITPTGERTTSWYLIADPSRATECYRLSVDGLFKVSPADAAAHITSEIARVTRDQA